MVTFYFILVWIQLLGVIFLQVVYAHKMKELTCITRIFSFKSIIECIDTQFETYLQEELKVKRSFSACHDTRIHACLYFVVPTGHGLKSLDLVCMKKLDSKVNIIPVIAKADTVSKTELHKFKIKVRRLKDGFQFVSKVFYYNFPPQIMSELVSNGVMIYQFPTYDETVSEINSTMNVCISSFFIIILCMREICDSLCL